MLELIHPERILFIDIETVTQYSSYEHLPDETKMLWNVKAGHLDKESEPMIVYQQRGAIYSEFSKIVCISVGYLRKESDHYIAKVKSFHSHQESQLLQDFSVFMEELNQKKIAYVFCGHNIREFDIPFICRRMLVNGFALPSLINFTGKKPWELDIVDTLQYWKFGDYKNYTSLKLLCHIFQITDVKGNMDGSMVGEAYWQRNALQDIVEYCASDVVAVMKLLMKLKQMHHIEIKRIEHDY